jgi:uncharacterized protein (DUF58 family)
VRLVAGLPAKLSARPTGKGVVVLVFAGSLFLIGTNTGSAWLYLLASACLTCVAASALWAPLSSSAVIKVHRGLLRCSVGEPVEYEVRVETKRRARDLILVDEATGSNPAVMRLGRPDSGSDRSRRDGGPRVFEGTMRAVPRKRGVFVDTPFTVLSEGPLGLWRAKRKVESTGTVEVSVALPDVGLPKELTLYAMAGEGKLEPPRRGRGYDFFALREYQPGDPVRHIYWPATARREEVVVREFEEEGVSPLAVVPCTVGETKAGIGPELLDEIETRILQVAGCLVKAAVRMHVPVRLAVPARDGGAPVVLDSPSASTLRSVLAEAPAPVDLAAVEHAIAAASRFPAASTVLVCALPFLDPIRALLPRARFALVVDGVVDGFESLGSRSYSDSSPSLFFVPLRGEICWVASSMPSAA